MKYNFSWYIWSMKIVMKNNALSRNTRWTCRALNRGLRNALPEPTSSSSRSTAATKTSTSPSKSCSNNRLTSRSFHAIKTIVEVFFFSFLLFFARNRKICISSFFSDDYFQMSRDVPPDDIIADVDIAISINPSITSFDYTIENNSSSIQFLFFLFFFFFFVD